MLDQLTYRRLANLTVRQLVLLAVVPAGRGLLMTFERKMLATALILLAMCSSLPGQELTEAEALKKFLEQSPQVRELKARVEITRAEESGRSLYPNPAFNYSRESAGFTEFFQAEQALPVAGRLGYLRQAGRAAVGVTEAEAAAVLWQLRSDLRLAFYRLLGAQGREALATETISELQEIGRILRAREKEGESSRYDRLRADRELTQARTEVGASQVFVTEARARLVSMLPTGTEVSRVSGQFSPAASLGGPAELVTRALSARAEYRAEQKKLERFRLEQRAAERLRYPEPRITFGLKRTELSAGSVGAGSAVGVVVPIPLFNSGRTEVARFKAERERSQALALALEQRIRAETEGAYKTLLLRQSTLEAFQRELGETGPELSRMARAAYQEGESGILELLDAYRVARQSRLQLLELQLVLKEAQIELDRAVGEEVSP